jgi:hypothetical protein
VGNYSYNVASGYANFPVSEVSWGDAARFCNWLANGQPATGVENATITETGSYALNGALTSEQLEAVTRSTSATYIIPSQNLGHAAFPHCEQCGWHGRYDKNRSPSICGHGNMGVFARLGG